VRQPFVSPWADRLGRRLRFVGTTLWTDFAALGAPEKAFRAANYYLKKTGTTELYGSLIDNNIISSAFCKTFFRCS